MSTNSKIEWTDATWNPVRGCTKVSPGCTHCYAETFAERWRGIPGHAYEQGFDLRLVPDKLDEPLKWKRPKRIFVNSMSDLFHKDVPDEFIDRVFAVMALCPQHTFQVLTKRPERMAEYTTSIKHRGVPLCDAQAISRVARHAEVFAREILNEDTTGPYWDVFLEGWPLPNVWLGTSVENQKYADERIPHLLRASAEVRFLSCEPLLGPIDLYRGFYVEDYMGDADVPGGTMPVLTERCSVGLPTIDWIIVGGESGPGARPMEAAWVRSIRDQCKAAAVPFFFKQWGGVRKKQHGRELDGRTHDEYPEHRAADLEGRPK